MLAHRALHAMQQWRIWPGSSPPGRTCLKVTFSTTECPAAADRCRANFSASSEKSRPVTYMQDVVLGLGLVQQMKEVHVWPSSLARGY